MFGYDFFNVFSSSLSSETPVGLLGSATVSYNSPAPAPATALHAVRVPTKLCLFGAPDNKWQLKLLLVHGAYSLLTTGRPSTSAKEFMQNNFSVYYQYQDQRPLLIPCLLKHLSVECNSLDLVP